MKRNCFLRHLVPWAGVLSIIIALFTACPNPSSSDPTSDPVVVQKYSVTYNGNDATGGEVPVDPNEYAEGAVVTVLANSGSLTKTDMNFVGWKTTAGGTSANRMPGTTFVMGTANVVLYAHWVVTGTTVYTVTFESNGGSATSPVGGLAAGSLVPEPEPDPVRSGHAFDGWYANEALTIAWDFDNDTISGNITLYARWIPLGGTPGAMPPSVDVMEASMGLSFVLFDLVEDILEDPEAEIDGLNFEADLEAGLFNFAFDNMSFPNGTSVSGTVTLYVEQGEDENTICINGSLQIGEFPITNVTFIDATWVTPKDDEGGGGPTDVTLSGSMVFDGSEYEMEDLQQVLTASYSMEKVFGDMIMPIAFEFLFDGGFEDEEHTIDNEHVYIWWGDYDSIINFDLHAEPEPGIEIDGDLTVAVGFDDPEITLTVNGTLSITGFAVEEVDMTNVLVSFDNYELAADSPPDAVDGMYSVDGIDYDVEYLFQLIMLMEMMDED